MTNDAIAKPFFRRPRVILALLGIVLVPAIVAGLWVFATLAYAYSKGERAGYVQKISDKGWVCKTWEGELAMQNVPGTPPTIFQFSVREERVAKEIEALAGVRVSLSYEQHKGVPTACFGETEYFITGVRKVAP